MFHFCTDLFKHFCNIIRIFCGCNLIIWLNHYSYFIFCSEKAFNFLLSFLAITSFGNLANTVSIESNSKKNSKTNSATNAKLNHKLQWTVIIFLGVISNIIILPGNSINFICASCICSRFSYGSGWRRNKNTRGYNRWYTCSWYDKS